MNKQIKRVEWIDFAKGFTILLVVLGHVFLGLYESKKFVEQNVILLFLTQAIYWFHMPVFFALSGYFFKSIPNIRELKNSVFNKLLVLGIPYVFYSVLYITLQNFGGGEVRNKASFTDLFLIWYDPIGVSWYLYVLFATTVIIGSVSIFVKNKNTLLLIFTIIYIVALLYPSDLYVVQKVMIWSIFFILGYIINDARVLSSILKNRKIVWIVSIISVLIFFFFWSKSNPTHYLSHLTPGVFGLIYIVSIPVAFSVYPILNKVNFLGINKYFSKYGKDSLVIYLLHAPIVSVTRIALLKLGIDILFVHIVVGLASGWFGSIIAIEIMKRAKYLDFVFYPAKYIKLKK